MDRLLNEILVRIAQRIDAELPSVSPVLFDGSMHLSSQLDKLVFSSREPAINVYTTGGEFLAHKDVQALTVLIPLSSSPQEYTGGGTAFWAQDSRGHRVEEPSIILKPNKGTAILFGVVSLTPVFQSRVVIEWCLWLLLVCQGEPWNRNNVISMAISFPKLD